MKKIYKYKNLILAIILIKKIQINFNHEDNANIKGNKSFYDINNLESKNLYSFDTFKESKNYQANNFIDNKPKNILKDSLSTFLSERNLENIMI